MGCNMKQKIVIGVTTDNQCVDYGGICPLDSKCSLKGWHMCRRYGNNGFCVMCANNSVSKENKDDFVKAVNNAGFFIDEHLIRRFINIINRRGNGRC